MLSGLLLAAAWPGGAPGEAPPRIYWTTTSGPIISLVQRAFVDGTGVETVASMAGNLLGVAVDAHRGKVYWAHPEGTILRADLDGSGAEAVLTGLGLIRALAVDPLGGKFYVSQLEGRIYRANLDGSGLELLLSAANLSPYFLALDLEAGKLYWSQFGGALRRANLDGSSPETVVPGLVFPQGVALDGAGKVYWVENSGRIRRAGLDGSGVEDLVTTSGADSLVIDVFGGRMYWAETSGRIRRAFLDGSGVEDVVTGLPGFPQGLAIESGFLTLFRDFADLGRLTRNGSAAQVGSALRLTPDVGGQRGSAFLNAPFPIDATTSFRTRFTFAIASSGSGADGFAFLVHGDARGASALGAGSHALGYGEIGPFTAITPSVAVEFDIFQGAGDPDGNHVAVTRDGNHTSHLAAVSPPFSLKSGMPTSAWVDYDAPSATLTVFVSQGATKPSTPLLSVPIDLASAVGDEVFIGFTAGTGGLSATHDVTSWTLAVSLPPGADLDGDGLVDPPAGTDTTPPVLTVPGDMVVEATGAAGATVTYSASAVDDVDGPVIADCVPASGAVFALGARTVTCTATDAVSNTATAGFTVTVRDTTAPVLTLPPLTAEATGPAGAAVTYAAAGVDLVDGAIPAVCTPASGATFPLGVSTVTCAATDGSGNTATGGFTVTVRDTPPPAPSITTAPASATSQRTASFTFTDAHAGVTFLCRRDTGSFAPCTSPKTYTNLGDGPHTFAVKARDAAGNESPAATHVWTIDNTAPPRPTITTRPAPLTAQTGATFGFTNADPGVAFVCALDGAGASPCASPTSYPGLGDGAHAFTVWAQDAAGNRSAAATYSWTIDTARPAAPAISAAPADPTRSTVATFRFSAAETAVTFLCALNGGEPRTCTSPKSYTGLAEGVHTFTVQARDGAGNVSPAASRIWTIDATPPPVPTVPQGPASSTNQSSALFEFADAEPGVTFLCRLDSSAFIACQSPTAYFLLAPGTHTFSVRAVDAAGNQSSIAKVTWTIDTKAPPKPSITATPAGSTTSGTATFRFIDSEAGVTFLCQLDGSVPAPCTSPAAYTGLASGGHAFAVRAQDRAGNVSGAATHTWTVLP